VDVLKKEVGRFFELIDSNAVGDNFQSALIQNVRAYFEECFGIKPPPYPLIGKAQKEIRERLMDKGGEVYVKES
jgi:hypothetical protein